MTADRRHLAFRKTRDGMWVGDVRLTGEMGAKLAAVLDPLSAPRNSVVTLEDGTTVVEPDVRRVGQRTHDALEEVCDRLLRSDTLPDSGGTPATVIVTIDADDLTNQARYGVTTDGTILPTPTVRRVVDAADVYAAVVTTAGVVLRMGRTRRIATPGQTRALTARDQGAASRAARGRRRGANDITFRPGKTPARPTSTT